MNPDRHAALPWTNVYGVARTVLALGTLINLACHDVNVLFRPLGVELGEAAGDIRLVRLSLFSILSGERLELASLLADVDPAQWRDCQGEIAACVRQEDPPAVAVVNRSITRVLCGEILVERRPPAPWAWSRSQRPVLMPARIARLEVRCGAEGGRP